MANVDGLLLVDKPAGPTSFGVLRSLQPALGRKLGHAGTLDPFATGLLLVVAGRWTRLATYLSGLDKEYRATVQLGAVSTTLDPEGEVTATGRRTDGEAVLRAAEGLVGTVLQRVPAASAVKIDGRRAYARMRAGERVEPAPRMVTVERLTVEEFDEERQRARIAVRCSKGTYVRQLAADLGEATGAGAYCVELRRLACGCFRVEDAAAPERIARAPDGPWLLRGAAALPHLPHRLLDADEAAAVRHGRAIGGQGEAGPTGLVLDDRLVAVAEPREGDLAPAVVLA